jgi:mono/diheme cytochrome c family protein
MTTRCRAAAALLLAGLTAGGAAAAAPSAEDAAEAARAVLFKNCVACHGPKETKPREGLSVLDSELLLGRKLVRPNNLDGSELWQLVECGTMPPGVRPKLVQADRDTLREWIASGARPFLPASGEAYALYYVRKDLQKQPRDDLRFQRYVSFNHLLGEPGAPSPAACRDALAVAVNHLSWKADPFRPEAVDPMETVFRLDLHKLGWDVEPFDLERGPNNQDHITATLFDLVALDYPYASPAGRLDGDLQPLADYLTAVTPKPLRPVLYVRGDWFVAAATRPPLYADLLRLPRTLQGLEDKLNPNAAALRGGLADSTVSRGNRVVERRVTKAGAYWRTYEAGPPKDKTALPDAAVRAADLPGLALFSLPNGLNGYYITDFAALGGGKREARFAEAAPADWVSDAQAPDRAARAGLSCVRCHAHGVQPFTDALKKDDLDGPLAADRKRYDEALERAAGHAPDAEALGRVTEFFLQHPPPAPAFAAIDSLATPRLTPKPAPVDVLFRALKLGETPDKPEKEASDFFPGDKMVIEVTNRGAADAYIELVTYRQDGTCFVGESVRKLKPGCSFRYPTQRTKNPRGYFPASLPEEKEQQILFASDAEFPGGIHLKRAKDVQDVVERIVHPFYEWSPERKEILVHTAADHVAKQTIEVATRETPSKK